MSLKDNEQHSATTKPHTVPERISLLFHYFRVGVEHRRNNAFPETSVALPLVHGADRAPPFGTAPRARNAASLPPRTHLKGFLVCQSFVTLASLRPSSSSQPARQGSGSPAFRGLKQRNATRDPRARTAHRTQPRTARTPPRPPAATSAGAGRPHLGLKSWNRPRRFMAAQRRYARALPVVHGVPPPLGSVWPDPASRRSAPPEPGGQPARRTRTAFPPPGRRRPAPRLQASCCACAERKRCAVQGRACIRTLTYE